MDQDTKVVGFPRNAVRVLMVVTHTSKKVLLATIQPFILLVYILPTSCIYLCTVCR